MIALVRRLLPSFVVPLGLLALPAALHAQGASAAAPPKTEKLPLKLAPRATTSAITAADLITRLYIFADDSMAGREVGTEGSVKATAYLAREAERIGLKPAGDDGTYFQTLPLKKRSVDPASAFTVNGTALQLGRQWGFLNSGTQRFDSVEVVYGGVIGDTTASLAADQARGRLVALTMPLTQSGVAAALGGDVPLPEGAAGLLVVVPQQALGLLNYVMQPQTFVADSENVSRLFIMDEALAKIAGVAPGALKVGAVTPAVKIVATTTIVDAPFPGRNVVGILPGSDPKLKHQYVAIGAHSDHIGTARRPLAHDSVKVFNRIVRPGGAEDEDKEATPTQVTAVNADLAALRATEPSRPDSIFNGADDDGSGSVTVLEIAQYLSSLKVKPKRSVLFVWHVGEEKGLWGSAWYTAHPTVPRDSIVAQLNMDMVGRGAASDETGKAKDGEALHGGKDYLQLVGSRRLSTQLGDLVERVNKLGKHNFVFDYAMDADGHPMNIYCRSDHYEYAKYGIPVTFFTTGGHADYHQLTDEPEYIDYPHMQRVGRLVADIALAVANQPKRPVVDKSVPPLGSGCKQ